MFTKVYKPKLFIAFICVIVGFMMAIQFSSRKEPDFAASRDNIDLRIDLQKERKRKEGLLNDLAKSEQLLYQYQNSLHKDSTDIMKEELEKVKREAGLVPISGEGVIIKLESIPEPPFFEGEYDSPNNDDLDSLNLELADEDLRTLSNELFNNGARAVAINGQRLVTTTTIRNVADRIQVNTHFISLPLEIRVLGDADNLIAGITGAGLEDYFKLLNLQMTIEKKSYLQVPAYEDDFTPRYMEPVKEDK